MTLPNEASSTRIDPRQFIGKRTSSGCSSKATDEFVGLRDKLNTRNSVDEKSAGNVCRYVVHTFENLTVSEEYQDFCDNANSSQTPIPQLQHSQIELGKLLGQGSFSDVFEVKKINSTSTTSSSTDIATNNRNVTLEADKVVVKVLRPKVTDDIAVFAAAASGLAREGAILGSLSHENIIQMKAFSQAGLCAYSTGRCDAFFVVLDRLHEVLKDRINHWCDMETHLLFSIRHRREKYRSFFLERLEVAADLANALSYLHKNNILHRDIKPANVGFTEEGKLKLFDFDVSRVLPKESHKDELFKLSIATGTQRYMSPECAMTGVCNLKSDVYSFSILFHEIISLECPFLGVSRAQFNEVVFRSGQRPRLHESWPKTIQCLLKMAWSEDIKVRPTMEQIHKIIRQEIKETEFHQQQEKQLQQQKEQRKRTTRGARKRRMLHLPTFKRTHTVGYHNTTPKQ